MLPPPPPQVFVAPFDEDDVFNVASLVVSAKLITAVDHVTRAYKVFLLSNLSLSRALRAQPRVYVHEPFTNEWRVLQNLPSGVEGAWVSSAVALHGSLFALKQHDDHIIAYRLSLFRYTFREDTWAEVYQMYFPRYLNSTGLVVSGDRLFLNVWLGGPLSSDLSYNRRFYDPGLKSDPNWPDPGPFFEYPNFPDTDTRFEMYEVLVADQRRKVVVQFTRALLQQIFGALVLMRFLVLTPMGSPTLSFWGTLHILGVSAQEIRLGIRVSGCLPPHPSVQSLGERLRDYYRGNLKNMKLSLRNALAQGPMVLRGCHYHG